MPQYLESFEGINASPNAPFAEHSGHPSFAFLQVGFQTDFTFGSGLTNVFPIPNQGKLAGHTITVLGDFRLGPANWSLRENGIIRPQDVPDGTAYIVSHPTNILDHNGFVAFAFPFPVYSVTLSITSDRIKNFADSYVGVGIFQNPDQALQVVTIKNAPVAKWKDNVVTIVSDKPFMFVSMAGIATTLGGDGGLVVDKVIFSDDRPPTITGTPQADIVNAGKTVPGQAKPSGASDVILGKGGDDDLAGRGGNDLIVGGNGRDYLRGQGGSDVLHGGKGVDFLKGGAGRDTFLFKGDISRADVIVDFNPRHDIINLGKKTFKALADGLPLAPNPLDPDAFAYGFDGVTDQTRIIYDARTGRTYYDSDGAGGKAPKLFARLTKDLDVTVDNFVVA